MSRMLDDQFARLAALRPARKRQTGAHVSRSHAAEACGDSHGSVQEPPAAPDALAQMLGATVGRNRYGEHLVVRRWYSSPEPCEPTLEALRLLAPISHDRAPRKLASRSQPRSPAAAASSPPPASADLERMADPAQWLFLDTETTGLAGGTGTYAFLVGVAWWDAGGLQVEQFFMRDYGEEHSVLVEIAERMAGRRVLVTFNGKSFDWPLLETRYAMTRAIKPQPPAAHLDLLHPARQLWRLRLGSVRLTELERHVLDTERLGWHRRNDVDSAWIPQIYFDYLRGGPLEPLAGVFRHNQMDLRGLAALAGRILALLSAPEAAGESQGLELCGLSRLLCRRGDASKARLLYERALGAGLPAEVDRAARRELALLARRARDFSRAHALWEQLAAPTLAGLEAYEQLAIHYEHRARDCAQAAEITRAALLALRKALRAERVEAGRYRKFQARLEYRLARVQRKLLSLRGSFS